MKEFKLTSSIVVVIEIEVLVMMDISGVVVGGRGSAVVDVGSSVALGRGFSVVVASVVVSVVLAGKEVEVDSSGTVTTIPPAGQQAGLSAGQPATAS